MSPLLQSVLRSRRRLKRRNPAPEKAPARFRMRRPEAEEMDQIRLREVRPLVVVGQEEACLLQLQRPLRLLWRWRSGGCWGPAAAAEMNRRQRVDRLDRPQATPALDRGATGGWHLDLLCPLCSRPCRVLFSQTWFRQVRSSSRPWGCRQCLRVTYRSSNTPGSSYGKRPESHAYRRHLETAIRIRRDFMGLDPDEAENVDGMPATFLVLKPRGCQIHWERWEALRALAMAHEALAEETRLARLVRVGLAIGLSGPKPKLLKLQRAYIHCLHEDLRTHAWATRQSSWHRQGLPRAGPEGRREDRLETS